MGSGEDLGDQALPRIQGYEITEMLGSGGMGAVYRARQIEFDREVALKVIHPHLARDEAFSERFRVEMRTAITLQHPNIVPVYQTGESGPYLFIAMLLVPGVDLATRVKKIGALPPTEAVTVIKQIAGALDEAHSRRLIHRDVKPHNVLVDERTDHVYLTDFGLARSLDASQGLTATGTRMGTIDYMSPEQIEGGDVGPTSDVYALGCLLYALVTGERPFSGDSEVSVIRQKLLGPSRPSLADLGFPNGLDQVVRRAQAEDPQQRYDTAGELAIAAATSLAPTGPARAQARPELARTEPHRRRRPSIRQAPTTVSASDPSDRSGQRRKVAFAILAALLIAVGGGAAAMTLRDEDTSTDELSGDAARASEKGGGATERRQERYGSDGAPPGSQDPQVDQKMLGTWSGDAQIYYEDGRSETLNQTIVIDKLGVGRIAGTSTAVQGASTCTGPITLERIESNSYEFSYEETNTEECIDTSVLTLARRGRLLDYVEGSD